MVDCVWDVQGAQSCLDTIVKNEKYPSEFVCKGEMICIYDIIRSYMDHTPHKQGQNITHTHTHSQKYNNNKFFFGTWDEGNMNNWEDCIICSLCKRTVYKYILWLAIKLFSTSIIFMMLLALVCFYTYL